MNETPTIDMLIKTLQHEVRALDKAYPGDPEFYGTEAWHQGRRRGLADAVVLLQLLKRAQP